MLTPGSEAWAYAHFGDPDRPGWYADNIRGINFCGRAMMVHRKARRAFLHLERIFRNHAPKYAAAINDGQLDDWSYSNRFIAGTSVKSNHAFGIALDINATKNYRGIRGDIPQAVVDRCARAGIRWGGSFSYPDAMHFECVLTPARVYLRYTKDGSLRRDRFRRRREIG